MALNEFESRWIHGLHDPGGEQIMLDAQRPGWVVITEGIGSDPSNRTGKDFRRWSERGLGVICRINHGYYPNGTLPYSRRYADFAQRVANFVAASPGCRIWIIGNEPNYSIEWPVSPARAVPGAVRMAARAANTRTGWWQSLLAWWRRMVMRHPPQPAAAPQAADEPVMVPVPGYAAPADDPALRGLPERFSAAGLVESAPRASMLPEDAPYWGEVITPVLYARCFRLCRSAIKRLRGHEQDLVLVAGPAPWNDQTRYTGNERGDWVQYLHDVLQLLGPGGCDGLALHTYTHGPQPERITSEARMRPPFTDRRFEFRTYRDFLDAVPPPMRDLPVYITETDQIDPWTDVNSGWVQRAYAEIDSWNRMPGTQKVRALVLYRWARYDRWAIEGKQQVIADLRAAIAKDYRWDREVPAPARFALGDRLRVRAFVNMRRSPGYVGKGPEDRVIELRPGDELVVTLGDSVEADNLTWWRVMVAAPEGLPTPVVAGWVAQYGPDGVQLLERVALGTGPTPVEPPTPPVARLAKGDWARTTTVVNARRTPGFVGKGPDDVVREVAAGVVLRLAEGPQVVDGLVWWRVQEGNVAPFGWMAESTSGGAALLERTDEPGKPRPRFRPGDKAVTLAFVRLRRTPGFMNKPADDVIADIWQGTTVLVRGGPETADGLVWWDVEAENITGRAVRGWMAESAPGDVPLLGEWTEEDRTPFKRGDFGVVGATAVRCRRTPGLENKPDNDVLGEYRARFTLYMLDGPTTVDRINWWRVSGIGIGGGRLIGWVAQSAANGATLVGRAAKLPKTEIPDFVRGRFLGMPFQGRFTITQLWAENPAFYSRYSYDGRALEGHNGIDFGTPLGTPILATDAGEVSLTGFEAGGFGNYVLLDHGWGQSVYAHLESVTVQTGQSVARGAVLGRAGNTGNSTGPHLHFAIRIHPYVRNDGWGGYSDPLPYLNPGDVLWPAYMLDTPRAADSSPEGMRTRPAPERRPPPGMAEDAPGLIRP